MKRKSTYFGGKPPRINVKIIYAGVFDVTIAEDAECKVPPDSTVKESAGRAPFYGIGSGMAAETYSYTMYNDIVRADNYGSFIAGAVHVRYSTDDEIALINKGIADSTNAEYVAYREFVEAVKAEAAKYFENN